MAITLSATDTYYHDFITSYSRLCAGWSRSGVSVSGSTPRVTVYFCWCRHTDGSYYGPYGAYYTYRTLDGGDMTIHSNNYLGSGGWGYDGQWNVGDSWTNCHYIAYKTINLSWDSNRPGYTAQKTISYRVKDSSVIATEHTGSLIIPAFKVYSYPAYFWNGSSWERLV